jgi:hypothetical protein
VFTCMGITRSSASKYSLDDYKMFVIELTKALDQLDQTFHDKLSSEATTSAEYLGETSQLKSLMHDYYERHSSTDSGRADHSQPSWGDFIDFLRRGCSVMNAWITEMSSIILIQNKAT